MKSLVSARQRDRWRPAYHAVLDGLRPRGVLTTINGTDTFRLSAAMRSVADEQEPDVWRTLMDEVRAGDVCLDIGASIGLYTLGFAARVGGRGRVFSFEPDFASYRLLQRHISLNGFSGVVCALNVAVGEVNTTLSFVDGLGPTSHVAGPAEQAHRVSVASLCLDSLLGGSGIVPSVVKIDVEGLELQVLRGAASVLAGPARPRLVYVDVHPWAWPALGLDTTEQTLHSLLRGLGYEVRMRNSKDADFFAVAAVAA